MPYRRRVVTIYSEERQKNICFTLPSGIQSADCDVHIVEAEKFRSSNVFELMGKRFNLEIGLPRLSLRHFGAQKMFFESEEHPVAMPFVAMSYDGQKVNVSYCEVNAIAAFNCLTLGLERFPFCVQRAAAAPDIKPNINPDYISRTLGAFRHEPAAQWESYSDNAIVHKAGYPYQTTACHALEFFIWQYDRAVADQLKVVDARDRLAVKLKGAKPSDYDAELELVRQLQTSGVDPELEPDLRWHKPDMIAYRRMLEYDENLHSTLLHLKKAEACRRYAQALHGIGDFSIEMPEPYNWNEHLKVFEALLPRIEAERDEPGGGPIDLVRRFNLLNGYKKARQKEIDAGSRLDDIWQGAADETIANLDRALDPLKRVILANNNALTVAKAMLKEKTFASLAPVASEPLPAPSLNFVFGPKGSGGGFGTHHAGP